MLIHWQCHKLRNSSGAVDRGIAATTFANSLLIAVMTNLYVKQVQLSSSIILGSVTISLIAVPSAQAVSLNWVPEGQRVTIDFEEFEAGTYITGDEWQDYGLTLSVESNRRRKDGSRDSLPLRLFNSSCLGSSCTGGDDDLATGDFFGSEDQGNVLIIQEDNSRRRNRNDLGAPDDDARGGATDL